MAGGPCPDCFSGSVHEGTPKGTITTIHGLETYIAEPADGVTPKGLVVFIPDAFGMGFKNNKLLCDKYAANGFLVYLPDFMKGSGASTQLLQIMPKLMKPSSWFDTLFMKPWLILQAMYFFIPFLIRTRPSICKPRVFSFMQAIRTSPPPFPTDNLKIGVAGFCWGGQHVFKLAADTPSSRVQRHESQTHSTGLEPLIDCAFTAHPSFVSMPSDAENVVVPTSVIVGDSDPALAKKSAYQMKEILEVKKKGDHEVVIVPGAIHGFGVRNDPSEAFQLECGQKSDIQAIEWFNRWLV